MWNFLLKNSALIVLGLGFFIYSGGCADEENIDLLSDQFKKSNFMNGVDEIALNYSGPTMITRKGYRIDDNPASFMTTESLCNQLAACSFIKEVTRLDLSKNCISDNGAQNIALLVEENLPNLKILDLSFNKIKTEGVIHFIPILFNVNLQYLNIVGNPTASLKSIRAVRKEIQYQIQYQKLHSERRLESSKKYVSKLIWLSKVWVDEKSANIPQFYIDAHRDYYNTSSK